MKSIELEEVSSTNEYCKEVDIGEDLIVTALRQSAGRGTKGRSFCSEEGGLYFSVMRHYTAFPAENAFKIMVNSCVAVCKTLEQFGLNPKIRWANDVLVAGKKICGTLIENTFCGKNIARSIVGMGINVNNVLPEDLRSLATTISEQGVSIAVSNVKNELINNLSNEYSIEDYSAYIDWFGREIILITDKDKISATALDVVADGRLLVEIGGKKRLISSAEVTLRL